MNSNFFLMLPVGFKNKCKVYPPSINEIIGNVYFNNFKKILTISQEEIEDEYLDPKNNKNIINTKIPTPLEFLLANCYHNKDLEKIAKKAFHFFIKEDVTFMYEKKAIMIGTLEDEILKIKTIDDLVFIEEEDYFSFQNLIREACGEKAIEPPNPNEDPRVKRIKAKARYREKIKAKKGMGITLETIMTSICCMGIGITPLNIGEMSYPAILSILNTYQQKEQYEIDIKALLAGGDSKKIKPKYWIRNLE